MSLKVGELEADVILDDSKFDKGLDGSKDRFNRFAKTLAQEAEKSGGTAGTALSDGLDKGMGRAGNKLGQEFAKSLGRDAAKAGETAGDELADGVDHGLDKARDKAKKFNDDLNKGAAKGGGEAGKSLTSGIGDGLSGLKALPALAAGSALGAAVIAGFMEAMDIEDANHLLAAQLGLNEKQAAKSGQIAGDLYKSAFGDSVADVNQVLETVFQNGLAKIGDSEDAIKGVTTQVMNFSKISKEDALPVTRAVAQMLKTGLAKNATEAFDILTRGQQLGINKSEDLLDTLNEYGTQFRKLGLDGKDSLGLINQMLQGGARDADTAADAIKEFSIRAIDGSKTTVDAYKSLHLNVKATTKAFGEGGPAAKKAFGDILDQLNAIKDPVERNRIGVELFGTKWEDLGASIGKADLDTAAASLGQVAGAAKDAGDTLNDTTSSGLASVGRTIKLSIVDAIGKYALPKLKEFAGWFNGPGKFVLVSWALDAASAFLDFSDKMLAGLQSMLGGLSKYAKIALIAAAGSVAVFNPGMAINMLKQADAVGKWADEAKDGLGGARTELQGWKSQLDKTNLKVKFQADIAELDAKIATAQKELKNPDLTKTRKAELTAEIKNLMAQKAKALGTTGLADPKLIATKTAKLTADIRTLDQKIADAKKALKAPHLTATKTAAIKADIRDLLAKKKRAQDAINALKGKTVKVVMQYTSTGVNLTAPSSVGRRAGGGPVEKGTPYIVGEKNPELFVPDEDGNILPRVPSPNGGGGSPYAGASGSVVEVRLELHATSRRDQLLLDELRDAIRIRGGNVQTVLGPPR
ncbi:phage tail tape measure protein [Kribbella sp. NPDC051718]|uniref:phage tail tape measure protein n=1 Tax=Kribbella sp. NPDC051718 TaxID=3155168 RepID=UPI0034401518